MNWGGRNRITFHVLLLVHMDYESIYGHVLLLVYMD